MMQGRGRKGRAGLLACALAAMAIAPGALAAPRVHTEGSVSYVSGGVGEAELDALSTLLPEGHNLEVVFAEAGTGAYVADVHVTLTDARGRTVLDTSTDGPALVAKVPPGIYTMTAEYKGVRQTRSVDLRRPVDLTLHWTPEAGSAPAPAATRVPHGGTPSESGPLPR